LTESEFSKKILKPFLRMKGWKTMDVDLDTFPDSCNIRDSVVMWIEYKTCEVRKTVITPRWQPGQLAWSSSYTEYGGLSALALFYDDVIYLLDPKPSYSTTYINTLSEEGSYPFKGYRIGGEKKWMNLVT